MCIYLKEVEIRRDLLISLCFHIQLIFAHTKISIISKIIELSGVFLKLLFHILNIQLTDMCIFSINSIFHKINIFFICANRTVYEWAVISVNLELFQKGTRFENNFILLPQTQNIPERLISGLSFFVIFGNLTRSGACIFWWWKLVFDFFFIFEIEGCIGFWFISFVWEVWSNHKAGLKWAKGAPSLRLVCGPPIMGALVGNLKSDGCLQTYDGQCRWILKTKNFLVCVTNSRNFVCILDQY